MTKPMIQKVSGRGSVPEVEAERYGNFYIFELINWANLFAAYTSSSRNKLHSPSPRDGDVQSLELKGDMNLQISDPASVHLKITLAQPPSDAFGTRYSSSSTPTSQSSRLVMGQRWLRSKTLEGVPRWTALGSVEVEVCWDG